MIYKKLRARLIFFKRGLCSSLDKYEKEYIESYQELNVIRKELTEIAKKIPKSHNKKCNRK